MPRHKAQPGRKRQRDDGMDDDFRGLDGDDFAGLNMNERNGNNMNGMKSMDHGQYSVPDGDVIYDDAAYANDGLLNYDVNEAGLFNYDMNGNIIGEWGQESTGQENISASVGTDGETKQDAILKEQHSRDQLLLEELIAASGGQNTQMIFPDACDSMLKHVTPFCLPKRPFLGEDIFIFCKNKSKVGFLTGWYLARVIEVAEKVLTVIWSQQHANFSNKVPLDSIAWIPTPAGLSKSSLPEIESMKKLTKLKNAAKNAAPKSSSSATKSFSSSYSGTIDAAQSGSGGKSGNEKSGKPKNSGESSGPRKKEDDEGSVEEDDKLIPRKKDDQLILKDSSKPEYELEMEARLLCEQMQRRLSRLDLVLKRAYTVADAAAKEQEKKDAEEKEAAKKKAEDEQRKAEESSESEDDLLADDQPKKPRKPNEEGDKPKKIINKAKENERIDKMFEEQPFPKIKGEPPDEMRWFGVPKYYLSKKCIETPPLYPRNASGHFPKGTPVSAAAKAAAAKRTAAAKSAEEAKSGAKRLPTASSSSSSRPDLPYRQRIVRKQFNGSERAEHVSAHRFWRGLRNYDSSVSAVSTPGMDLLMNKESDLRCFLNMMERHHVFWSELHENVVPDEERTKTVILTHEEPIFTKTSVRQYTVQIQTDDNQKPFVSSNRIGAHEEDVSTAHMSDKPKSRRILRHGQEVTLPSWKLSDDFIEKYEVSKIFHEVVKKVFDEFDPMQVTFYAGGTFSAPSRTTNDFEGFLETGRNSPRKKEFVSDINYGLYSLCLRLPMEMVGNFTGKYSSTDTFEEHYKKLERKWEGITEIASSYAMTYQDGERNFMVDPTWGKGRFDRKVAPFACMNEPNPKHYANCEVVAKIEERETKPWNRYCLRVYTNLPVMPLDELLIYYGPTYDRDYEVGYGSPYWFKDNGWVDKLQILTKKIILSCKSSSSRKPYLFRKPRDFLAAMPKLRNVAQGSREVTTNKAGLFPIPRWKRKAGLIVKRDAHMALRKRIIFADARIKQLYPNWKELLYPKTGHSINGPKVDKDFKWDGDVFEAEKRRQDGEPMSKILGVETSYKPETFEPARIPKKDPKKASNQDEGDTGVPFRRGANSAGGNASVAVKFNALNSMNSMNSSNNMNSMNPSGPYSSSAVPKAKVNEIDIKIDNPDSVPKKLGRKKRKPDSDDYHHDSVQIADYDLHDDDDDDEDGEINITSPPDPATNCRDPVVNTATNADTVASPEKNFHLEEKPSKSEKNPDVTSNVLGSNNVVGNPNMLGTNNAAGRTPALGTNTSKVAGNTPVFGAKMQQNLMNMQNYMANVQNNMQQMNMMNNGQPNPQQMMQQMHQMHQMWQQLQQLQQQIFQQFPMNPGGNPGGMPLGGMPGMNNMNANNNMNSMGINSMHAMGGGMNSMNDPSGTGMQNMGMGMQNMMDHSGMMNAGMHAGMNNTNAGGMCAGIAVPHPFLYDNSDLYDEFGNMKEQ